MDSIDYYNRCAVAYYENTVELNMETMLEQFIELLPESPTVLDMGCGSGRDSLYFIEKGFDVTAIDGAKELCNLAEIHIGQDVLCMNFAEMNFDEVFDGVWANASLLHESDEEIDGILDRVIKSIKPDGILYMSFRYGTFTGIRDDRFFVDYKMKTMKELIGRHKELEIIEIIRTDDVGDAEKGPEWINVFVRKCHDRIEV